MTENCEGDKIKAVMDTNKVQEIDPDAKADARQSSGNKDNERKKNSPSAVQTLKGLELNYDNDFDYKRHIDVNTSKEPQSTNNSCNLSPNEQFDNVQSHWANKCNQVPLEREFVLKSNWPTSITIPMPHHLMIIPHPVDTWNWK